MRFVSIFSALILLVALTGCAGMNRNLDSAPSGTQSIVMWHKPSGERISVTYRSGGRYNAAAFDKIDNLFRDRRNGDEYAIDPALIDVIADLRDKMMMDVDTPIELTSGYRSSESNSVLARSNKYVARNSFHTKGQAADIRIPGMIPSVLELVAKTMQRGGVALYPDSGHVHVDVGPVRGWEVKRGREEGSPSSSGKASSSGNIVRSKGLTPVEGVAVPLPPKAGAKASKTVAPPVAPAVRVRSNDSPVTVKEQPAAATNKPAPKLVKTPYKAPAKSTAKKPVPKTPAKAAPRKPAAKTPVKTTPKTTPKTVPKTTKKPAATPAKKQQKQ